MPPMQAAIEATKEIALAVMATTLSLVIIFVPIAFMTGYAKRFMNQFGWTMAISIMVSMLVAFTLTPTLSARLLKLDVGSARTSRRTSTRSDCMERGYTSNARLVDGPSLGRLSRSASLTLRFHVRRQPLHRPRLDAAGRPERARCLAGDCRKARRSTATEKLALEVGQEAGRDSRRHRGGPGMLAHHGARHHGFITVLLKPTNERDDIQRDGAEGSGRAARLRAIARPRITFPNALGGRDTFSPIRAHAARPGHGTARRSSPKKLASEMMKEPSLSPT